MIHNSEHANLFLCLVFTLRLMISEFYLLSFKSETNEYSNALMMMTSSILLVKWFFTLMWFSTMTVHINSLHYLQATPDASWIRVSISTSFPQLSQSRWKLSAAFQTFESILWSLPNSWSPCLLLCHQPEGCRQWPEVSDFVACWASQKKTTAMWELHENSMHFSYGSGVLNAKCVI